MCWPRKFERKLTEGKEAENNSWHTAQKMKFKQTFFNWEWDLLSRALCQIKELIYSVTSCNIKRILRPIIPTNWYDLNFMKCNEPYFHVDYDTIWNLSQPITCHTKLSDSRSENNWMTILNSDLFMSWRITDSRIVHMKVGFIAL